MTQLEQWINFASFTLASTLSSGATTLTPPSYAGFPATGQLRLVFSDNREIVLVTDLSARPWPISRAQETTLGGGPAASHAAGVAVYAQLTAGALDNFFGVSNGGVLAATGRQLDFSGGGVGVTQNGATVAIALPTWSPLVDQANSALVFGPTGDTIDVPSNATGPGPTSSGADPTLRYGFTATVPFNAVPTFTYVPLDAANGTINQANGISAYTGDSHRLQFTVPGRYLAVISCDVQQHATSWATLDFTCDNWSGDGTTIAVPPASVYTDSGGFGVSASGYIDIAAITTRPAFQVYTVGATLAVILCQIDVQYVGPL